MTTGGYDSQAMIGGESRWCLNGDLQVYVSTSLVFHLFTVFINLFIYEFSYIKILYTYFTNISMCIYIYMYTNVCIYIYIHKIIHICSYHSYTFTYIHIYIYMYLSIFIYNTIIYNTIIYHCIL